MSSTYSSLHYHLVFSTKNREATMAPEWRDRVGVELMGNDGSGEAPRWERWGTLARCLNLQCVEGEGRKAQRGRCNRAESA
jgi:hypothetical protein